MILKIIVALVLPVMNLVAQIMVKYLLMHNHSQIKDITGLKFVVQMLSIPGIWLVAIFQLGSFVLWGFVISRMELGVANALAGSFYYLLSAASATLLFRELLTVQDWLGITMISAGALVLLLKTVH